MAFENFLEAAEEKRRMEGITAKKLKYLRLVGERLTRF
jgi:hypothetical protein